MFHKYPYTLTHNFSQKLSPHIQDFNYCPTLQNLFRVWSQTAFQEVFLQISQNSCSLAFVCISLHWKECQPYIGLFPFHYNISLTKLTGLYLICLSVHYKEFTIHRYIFIGDCCKIRTPQPPVFPKPEFLCCSFHAAGIFGLLLHRFFLNQTLNYQSKGRGNFCGYTLVIEKLHLSWQLDLSSHVLNTDSSILYVSTGLMPIFAVRFYFPNVMWILGIKITGY